MRRRTRVRSEQFSPIPDVDDAVGLRSRRLEPIEVGKIPTTHVGAERGRRCRSRVGPGQGGDLVAGRDEFGDDVRTGVAGSAASVSANLTYKIRP